MFLQLLLVVVEERGRVSLVPAPLPLARAAVGVDLKGSAVVVVGDQAAVVEAYSKMVLWVQPLPLRNCQTLSLPHQQRRMAVVAEEMGAISMGVGVVCSRLRRQGLLRLLGLRVVAELEVVVV